MFSALCLLASAAILFFVLKYRVHVHVTYTRPEAPNRATARRPSASAQVGRRNRAADPPAAVPPVSSRRASFPVIDPEIVSALRNLGCTANGARKAAERAIAESPDFDTALRKAIQYAREAA